MCVCVVCVFVIEENVFYFAMVMCELRCELGGGGGGGREGGRWCWPNIGFPSQYQPIPPAFDIN